MLLNREWRRHLANRWSKHVGNYHECSWDRPWCIKEGLATPGMHNEPERSWPYATYAYLHLLNLRDRYNPEPFRAELYE